MNNRPSFDDLRLQALRQNGKLLRFYKAQTMAMCLAAVSQSGLALRYVKNQTPEVCRVALEQDPRAARYIRQTDGRERHPYRVMYDKPVGQRCEQSFYCWATDARDAIKQADAAYPNREVIDAKRISESSWLVDYEPGDMVWWRGPEGAGAYGQYAIKEMPDVAIEDDSIVIIEGRNNEFHGQEFRVEVSELDQFRPADLLPIVNEKTALVCGYAVEGIEAQAAAAKAMDDRATVRKCRDVPLANGTILDRAWVASLPPPKPTRRQRM